MDNKNIKAMAVGIIIGALCGGVAVSILNKPRFQYYPSPSGTKGVRMNLATGETWVLDVVPEEWPPWVKVPEPKGETYK